MRPLREFGDSKSEVEGRTSGAWTAGRRPGSGELDSFDRVLGPLEKGGATLSADNRDAFHQVSCAPRSTEVSTPAKAGNSSAYNPRELAPLGLGRPRKAPPDRLAPLLLGMRLNRDTLPIAGEAHVTPSVVYISLTHIPLRNDENHGFSCKTVLRRLASENRLTGTANDGRGSDST
jgi:hypothetical protein